MRCGSVKGSNSGGNGKLWIEIFRAQQLWRWSQLAGAPLAAAYLLGMLFSRELKRIPEANDRCGGWYVLKRAQTNVNNHTDLGMGATDRWTAGAEGTSRIGIRRDHGT